VREVGYVEGRDIVIEGRRAEHRPVDLEKAAVIERGYEGYVAKEEASAYEAGATRRWLKVKQADWTIGDDRWTRRISVGQSSD
jgi:ATP-dependent DNA ligase